MDEFSTSNYDRHDLFDGFDRALQKSFIYTCTHQKLANAIGEGTIDHQAGHSQQFSL